MTQNETLLLGIDIGTTGTKCAIYDLKGELVAHAYQEYSMIHHSRPGPSRIPIAGGTPSRRIYATALSSKASTAAASPPSA